MAEHSRIEWTDATWNPITGCTLVSEGCRNCYAAELAAGRLAGHPSRHGLARRNADGVAAFTGEVRFNEAWLDQPLRWRRPRRIFVCAHGDLFHPAVPDAWIMRVLNVMAQCPWHTFQVLTKRPERMREFFALWCDLEGEDFADFKDARGPDAVRAAHPSGRGKLFAAMVEAMGEPPPGCAFPTFDWMNGMMRWPDALPNVWLGVSAEDQTTADARIPPLLDTPAAVRFLSAEPLLGPIDLEDIETYREEIGRHIVATTGVSGLYTEDEARQNAPLPPLDWVIVGGESGRHARPMHPDWARSLRDQCQAAGVPFFFKQWGEWRPDEGPPNGSARDRVFEGRAACAWWDGRQWHHEPTGYDVDLDAARGHGEWVFRLGKRTSGRLLDDQEHSEMPA